MAASEARHPEVLRVVHDHLRSELSARPDSRIAPLAAAAGLCFTAAGVTVAHRPAVAALAGAVGLAIVVVASLRAAKHRPVDPAVAAQRFFDHTTSMPLVSAVPLVLGDPSASSTLTGRVGLVSVELLGGPTAAALGGPEAVEMVAAVTAHRLRSRGWVQDSAGPFGPIVFRRSPYGFVILLRDVLDRKTSRLLAVRMQEVLQADIRCRDSVISPEPVVGVAIGSVAEDPAALLRGADQARLQASMRGSNSVVLHDDEAPAATAGRLLMVRDPRTGSDIGVESGTRSAGRDIRHELERGLDEFAEALAAGVEARPQSTQGRCYVRIAGAALCRPDAAEKLLATIRRGVDPGVEVVIVAPATIDLPGMRAAWNTIEQLRASGVCVLLDTVARSAVTADSEPAAAIDGIVLDADLVATGMTDAGFEALVRLVLRARAQRWTVLARVAGPAHGEIVERLEVDAVVESTDRRRSVHPHKAHELELPSFTELEAA